MFSSEYYGNDNGYYDKPERKRGAGGYILTAVIAFIVGVLVASVFLTAGGGALGITAQPTEKPEAAQPAEPETEPTPAQEQEATPTPESTAVPETTERPMPELDGVAPSVADSSNPLPDVIEQVSPGVVGIVNYAYSDRYQQNLESASGSGFIISADGYIITNSHVVEDAVQIGVLFVDGEEVTAELVGFDKTSDIAVLKVDKTGLTALKLGDSDSLRVGEFVVTIGDPTGRELAGTATFGIVSATKRSVNIDGITNDYIQTDAAVNPGNSGGPLLNTAGEVVGITSAKTVTASYDEYGNAISAEGLGFALPINDAMNIVTQLITTGEVKRPGLGISVLAIDEMTAAYYKIPQGVLVYTIVKDGPAHLAGFEINDIIIECDGVKVTDQDEFVSRVKGMTVGDTVEFVVWRYGTEVTITLKLTDLNTLNKENIEGVGDFEKFLED